jgi:ribosomal protein S18 acetylase RimI-like enzyme
MISTGLGSPEVTVRPLEPGDANRLLEFFRRIPGDERFYLKEDVTSPEIIQRWVENLDFDRVIPLVAVLGDRIIVDATLHRHRSGARKHLGEIRVVVDPEFRDLGLGTMMMEELIDIAYGRAMDSVTLEVVENKEDRAIEVALGLGFNRVATLPNLVRDTEGKPQNLIIMELSLERWLQGWNY